MPDDDKPLDIADQPFASGLDEPRATPQPDPDDDVWGAEPPPAPGAEAPGPVADEWARPRGQSSSLLLLMGVVVLVMVGVVIFLAINGNDDSKEADPAIPTTAPVAGAPVPDPGAGVAPPSTAPDPGSDPDLEADGVLADDFERPGPELGTYPGGAAWTNLAGTIDIEKGVARTLDVDPNSNLQLATVDAGSADVTVEVKLPSPVDRSGVAIRVASPDRFIGLFATNDYGTYTLARFENGKLDPDDIIGNTDLSGVGVGDVIGIRAKGTKIEVLTNGTVRNSFDDPKLAVEGTGVGLFAFLDDTGPETVDAREFANWDDFKYLPAS